MNAGVSSGFMQYDIVRPLDTETQREPLPAKQAPTFEEFFKASQKIIWTCLQPAAQISGHLGPHVWLQNDPFVQK